MLKGLNRSVIVVRTDRKSRFEAIYFVLKKGSASDKGDIIKEANQIISDTGYINTAKKHLPPVRSLLLLLGGAVIGALCTTVVALILTF